MKKPFFSLELEQFRRDFHRDGYVVVRGFLSRAELAELKRELERYTTIRVPKLPREDVYYQDLADPSTLKQLARMKKHDRYFADLIARDRFIGLVEALLSDQVFPQEVEWFDKPPRVGQFTPPHQDGYYFMLEPNQAATMWLALDPVDESNGCVRYIPGSHRYGLRPHGRTQVLGFSQGITDYSAADADAEVPVLAQPGDLLVHHALTIHRADGNTSERHRRSLGLVYYAASAQQDRARVAAYQQNLYQELKATQKI
jgi:phytanoyl-CoA hydroxylase